jgi:glycosyltransferase involved in cell wall biosynthesis
MAHLVEHLGDRFEFFIAALDRDLTSKVPYANVRRNAWNRVGKANVFYSSRFSMRRAVRLIRQSAPDILYLNSFFWRSTVKVLILRRLGALPAIPVIVGPHGEFSAGALQLKAARKRAFISAARILGLYQNVLFHASTVWEERDIRKALGRGCNIHVASELPPLALPETHEIRKKPEKLAGQLRLVFLSRITPKKNLRFAIEMLGAVPGDVRLDLYGPIEDPIYWHECVQEIRSLPFPDRVRYHGPIPHQRVFDTLSRYHFFLLPTLGENFGYAIIEALLAGCPVLISDTTPWRNLFENHVGWDLPLDQPDCWKTVLRQAAAMDQAMYSSYSNAAREFAVEWTRSPERELQTLELFRKSLETYPLRVSGAAERHTPRMQM